MTPFDTLYAEQARRLHRHRDPDTSREAAGAVALELSRIQNEVLAYARGKGFAGFTDKDLVRHFDDDGSTYRSRRAELVERGLLMDSGNRRLIGRRRHVIWVTVEAQKEFNLTGRAL